jgi:Glycosyltransferase family 28 C-terminal domain
LSEPLKIDFVYFDAGGGHRSAALALQSVIAAGNYDWDVRLVNLQEVLDPLDVFRKVTGVRLQDLYNLLLAKGWTLGSSYLLPAMQKVIRLYHRPSVKLLTTFWGERRPDLVVSLVPNLNRAMFEGLRAAGLTAPYVTIMTDLADYPPHFWIEKQPQFFICGTARAVEQATRLSHPRSRVLATSGMILRPDFYRQQTCDRRTERMRLGLDPDLTTGLVLFGGEGSNTMREIARSLGTTDVPIQMIFICGRNQKLRHRLSRLQTRNKILVEGFTKEIPYFMHLSDFFVGKPGPGSISEALKMGLPPIIESNAWTLPQERYNAQWLREQELGIVLPNFRQIQDAVASLLQDQRLARLQEKARALDNRAVFEIPCMLEQILSGACSLR